jgi:hypothetical protein
MVVTRPERGGPMADWRIGHGVAILLLVVASGVVSGCASSRAQVLEDQPTLAVPPVPPRSIEPPAIVEPPPVEPLPEVALPPATTTKPAPRPGTRATDRPESKPEPPAEATPPPATNPAPVAPLRTPNTPSGPEAARQIKDMLDRAADVLNRVDFQRLSDDRKANYRAAQSFVAQGREALKREDLSLARSFAVRAEDIARQLESSGRK